jgi:ribonucleoside-diphosphate reductase subunit M1
MLGAIMPTASTANVFRNAESTEALQSNVFSREIQKGNYLITSRHLEKDLRQIGCWSFNLMKFIITCEGSVKHMIRYITDHPDEFPKAFHDGSLKADVLERLEYLVLKYKTMFEISQKTIILMSRHRGIYIDQSQSLNIHVSDPKEKVLEALHMYSYFMGLKTGMYYLRQSPAKFVGSFDVDPSIIAYKKSIEDVKKVAGPVRFLVGGGEQPSLTDDERAALTHVGLPIASSSLVPTTISAPAVCKIGAKYSEGCMSCQ